MFLIELPNEMLLNIIYKLNYIDVLHLYLVSQRFKTIIDKYLYSIYLSFKKSSCELYWHQWENNYKDWNKPFNYTMFSNIYSKGR